jgi:hypothetical protein
MFTVGWVVVSIYVRLEQVRLTEKLRKLHKWVMGWNYLLNKQMVVEGERANEKDMLLFSGWL